MRHLMGLAWPLDRQRPLDSTYSILLGVPWALHDLTDVNLKAISQCRLDRLRDIHVVFDRPQKPGMREFADRLGARWPQLPIRVHWHPPLIGRLVEKVGVSTFFNGANILTALRANRSKCLILHDFDLYPLKADFFEAIAANILDKHLDFSGFEFTEFNALTAEDRVIGTWGLAINVERLCANHRAHEVLHRRMDLPDGRQ